MARVLSFLIRYFSNYYTLHRSDLAARAAPLDPRLHLSVSILQLDKCKKNIVYFLIEEWWTYVEGQQQLTMTMHLDIPRLLV